MREMEVANDRLLDTCWSMNALFDPETMLEAVECQGHVKEAIYVRSWRVLRQEDGSLGC